MTTHDQEIREILRKYVSIYIINGIIERAQKRAGISEPITSKNIPMLIIKIITDPMVIVNIGGSGKIFSLERDLIEYTKKISGKLSQRDIIPMIMASAA